MTLRYAIHVSLEEIQDIFGITLEEEQIYASDDKNLAVQVFDRLKAEVENNQDAGEYKFNISIYLSDEVEGSDIAFVTSIATDDKENALSDYVRFCDLLKNKLLPSGS